MICTRAAGLEQDYYSILISDVICVVGILFVIRRYVLLLLYLKIWYILNFIGSILNSLSLITEKISIDNSLSVLVGLLFAIGLYYFTRAYITIDESIQDSSISESTTYLNRIARAVHRHKIFSTVISVTVIFISYIFIFIGADFLSNWHGGLMHVLLMLSAQILLISMTLVSLFVFFKKSNNDTFKEISIIVDRIFIPASASALLALQCWANFPFTIPPKAVDHFFDPQGWQCYTPLTDVDSISQRQYMIADLKRNILPGKKKDQIVSILGNPENSSEMNGRNKFLIYPLGKEPLLGKISGRNSWLLVYCDWKDDFLFAGIIYNNGGLITLPFKLITDWVY
jgi:hypothetical protein